MTAVEEDREGLRRSVIHVINPAVGRVISEARAATRPITFTVMTIVRASIARAYVCVPRYVSLQKIAKINARMESKMIACLEDVFYKAIFREPLYRENEVESFVRTIFNKIRSILEDFP